MLIGWIEGDQFPTKVFTDTDVTLLRQIIQLSREGQVIPSELFGDEDKRIFYENKRGSCCRNCTQSETDDTAAYTESREKVSDEQTRLALCCIR